MEKIEIHDKDYFDNYSFLEVPKDNAVKSLAKPGNASKKNKKGSSVLDKPIGSKMSLTIAENKKVGKGVQIHMPMHSYDLSVRNVAYSNSMKYIEVPCESAQQYFAEYGIKTHVKPETTNPHEVTAIQRRIFEHKIFDGQCGLRLVGDQYKYTRTVMDLACGPRAPRYGLPHVTYSMAENFSIENTRRIANVTHELSMFKEEHKYCDCTQGLTIEHIARQLSNTEKEKEVERITKRGGPNVEADIKALDDMRVHAVKKSQKCPHLDKFTGNYLSSIDSAYYFQLLEAANYYLHQNPSKSSFDILHVFDPMVKKGKTTIGGKEYGEWARIGTKIQYSAHANGFSFYEHEDRWSDLFYYNSIIEDGIVIQVLDRFRNGSEDYILVHRQSLKHFAQPRPNTQSRLNVDFKKRDNCDAFLVYAQARNVAEQHNIERNERSNIRGNEANERVVVPVQPFIARQSQMQEPDVIINIDDFGNNAINNKNNVNDKNEDKDMFLDNLSEVRRMKDNQRRLFKDKDGDNIDIYETVKGHLRRKRIYKTEPGVLSPSSLYRLELKETDFDFVIPLQILNDTIRKITQLKTITPQDYWQIAHSMIANHAKYIPVDDILPIIMSATQKNCQDESRIYSIHARRCTQNFKTNQWIRSGQCRKFIFIQRA